MARTREDHDSAVASLVFCDSRGPRRQQGLLIHPYDQFDVGRKDVFELTGNDERTISTHHLRFRCIVYEDGEQPVTPMVYMSVLSTNAPQLVRYGIDTAFKNCVSRSAGDILLNDGDVVKLTPRISVLFRADGAHRVRTSTLDGITKAELERLNNQYIVTDRLIGAGAYAGVFVALERRSGRQVACKIVTRPKTTGSGLFRKSEKLAREYTILKDLNHPNVISLEKVICSTSNIYIFQELITGGDLLSYLDQRGALSEPEAISITRQLLKAVEYLHDNGVVHRDIKPENVLMTSWRNGARVILTDFGQARTVEDASTGVASSAVFRMQSLVGTRGYTAPEARLLSLLHPQNDDFCSNSEAYSRMKRNLPDQTYGKAIDIWSIGCVAAVSLTNEILFPYDDDPDGSTALTALCDHESRTRQDIDVIDHGRAWRQVGQNAKNFVKSCLAVDESARLTANEALAHKWLAHKHYAGDLEAAYARATKDWKPRRKTNNLIEYIDTTDIVPSNTSAKHVQRVAEEAKSRYFNTPSPPAHMALTFGLQEGRLVQQGRSTTSLPPISRDPPDDTSMESTSPQRVSGNSGSAEPMDGLETLHLERPTQQSMERLSIEDFAPPGTQFTFHVDAASGPGPPPLTYNDSLTHLGVTLERFRPALVAASDPSQIVHVGKSVQKSAIPSRFGQASTSFR